MKLIQKVTALLLIAFTALTPAFAQSPANGPNPGNYGLTAWAINNQRVASQYNYYIDSSFQSGVGGTFAFPSNAILQALAFGANRFVNPFNTNASVQIIDISSSLTETATFNSVTFSGSIATLNLTTVNAHTSYVLRSGTCGLREALNDLGANGGEVIVDQKFYDDGCTAATITGLANSGGLRADQYIHDISAAQDTWYGIKPTSLTLTAAPTALTTVGGAAATLNTATTGGTIATAQAIRSGITCVDALGRETPLSVDTSANAVVTTGAGSTNSITVTAPGTTGCPNSVGYRLYLSANAGATLSEILYAPSAVATTGNQCTQAPNSVIVTACALTSNSVVVSIITSTAGIPMSGVVSGGSGATAIGYLPYRTLPATPGFRLVYGPFPAITTVTTVQPAAELIIPAGALNTLGQAYRLCLAGVGTPAAATVAGTFNLTLGPRQATGVQTIDSVPFTASSTWNPAAASNWSYCTIITTAATGATGTIEAHTDSGFQTSATAGAVPPAFGPQLDV